MAEVILKGQCRVTGYMKQSLKCANCKYNRVECVRTFLDAQRERNKTKGTMCVAEEYGKLKP